MNGRERRKGKRQRRRMRGSERDKRVFSSFVKAAKRKTFFLNHMPSSLSLVFFFFSCERYLCLLMNEAGTRMCGRKTGKCDILRPLKTRGKKKERIGERALEFFYKTTQKEATGPSHEEEERSSLLPLLLHALRGVLLVPPGHGRRRGRRDAGAAGAAAADAASEPRERHWPLRQRPRELLQRCRRVRAAQRGRAGRGGRGERAVAVRERRRGASRGQGAVGGRG